MIKYTIGSIEYGTTSDELVEEFCESKQDTEKFMQWLGKKYAPSFDEFTAIKPSLPSPYGDFYWWMKNRTPEGFASFVGKQYRSHEDRKELSRKATEGANLVYSDDKWKVYHITSYEASCRYGKNTKWCISGSKRWADNGNGRDFWDSYRRKGIDFYFFIRSNDEKYSLTIYPEDNHFEIYNQNDISIPAIPDAPRIPSIEVDYLIDDDMSALSRLCIAMSEGKMSRSVVFPLMNTVSQDCNDDDFSEDIYDSSSSGMGEVCQTLRDNIPDGYLEYSSACDRRERGLPLSQKDTEVLNDGDTYPGRDSWGGDIPRIDSLLLSDLSKDETLDKDETCSADNPELKGYQYFMVQTYNTEDVIDMVRCKDWFDLLNSLANGAGVNDSLFEKTFHHQGGNVDSFILMCVNEGIREIKDCEAGYEAVESEFRKFGLTDSLLW